MRNFNKLKVAIIGCGSMGRNHLRVCQTMKTLDVVALVDPRIDQAVNLCKPENVSCFDSVEDLIAAGLSVDAAIVATPTNTHFQVASLLLSNSVHVLLEKPIASSVKEGLALCQLAKQQSVILQVGHIERFNPVFLKARSLVGEGSIGDLVCSSSKRVGLYPPRIADADIAVDLAVHDIDLANLIFDAKPVTVTANRARNLLEDRDDSIELLLQYERGSAFIQANWITPVKVRQFEVTGTKGFMKIDFLTQKIELYQRNSDFNKLYEDEIVGDLQAAQPFITPQISEISVSGREPLVGELDSFFACIRGMREPQDNFNAVSALSIATKQQIGPYESIYSRVS